MKQKKEKANMEYSLAEVTDMINEFGFRKEEIPTAVIMFSMAFVGVDPCKLKSFTGYANKVDDTIQEMRRLGMVKGKNVVGEWSEKNGGIAFGMDVYSVMGYFLISYKKGERNYRSNPDKLHPFFREWGEG